MFAGLISKEQTVSAWGDATKIMAALAPYSLDKPRDIWLTDKHLLLQVATRTGSTTAEIFCHSESGIAVAFWGRLDNRPDLIAQLDAEHKASDDELIALAWLKWGEYCPEKLIGDFAFAIISPRTGVVFLARDVMGVKPLYYRTDENGVFFASTAAAFKPLQLGTLTRSQKWMAEYMLGLSYSHTDTAYEEIKKLQGAHCMLIHADGRMNIRRYHQFVDDAPIEKKRDPKYLEAYKAAWQEAVACRMPATGNIGTENSGGLDSGSITAELARQLGKEKDRLYGFGYCLELLEPECIMATVMKYELRNQYMISDPADSDYKNMQEREILVSGYPQEHENAAWYRPFYEQCKMHDIGVLFSGFGGDEVVTNAESFPEYELLDNRDYRNFFRISSGSAVRRLARTVKRALLGMATPEVHLADLDAYRQRWQLYYLDETTIEKFELKERYLGQVNAYSGFRQMNPPVMAKLATPDIQTRVENCTQMAASYGIDYAWPLLDARLVQMWLSTPSIWKLGNQRVRRYLHRMAVDGVCPDVITWKLEKDMGYNQTEQYYENHDNTALFVELLEICKRLPSGLAFLINQFKAEGIAKSAIASDIRGVEVYTSIKYSVEHLSDLCVWLAED